MRVLLFALLLCLPVLRAASAADAGILLAVSTSAEARAQLVQEAAQLPGVLATAEIGRRQLPLVRSRTAGGAIVDQAATGYRYMLDAMAFDPVSYARLQGVPALAMLQPGDAVLGESSARLRRIGVGGRLEFADGAELIVRAVVPDAVILNREVAFAAAISPGDRRQLWLRYDGPHQTFEEALAARLPSDTPLRIRALDESDFIEGYAPVLPQVRLKLALGEFSFRPTTGTSFVRDARWETNNLMTAEVPLIGRVRCHRLLVPALRGAMQELIDKDLAHLIAPRAFQGCDNPRLIGEGRSLSRHAWGAAVDLNYSSDRVIRANASDPRLVAIMAKWGFLSGHLFNDPGHFEYAGAPAL
jgi:hypothetical protein